MARHLRNPKIESRAARAKLKPSLKPTYFGLGGKLHLGYRRGKGPGVWVARVYVGDERYVTKTLGESDDLADANGATVLSFADAQVAARAWAADHDKAERLAALGPVITVKIAIREYLEQRSTTVDARAKLSHLAPLAEKPLAELTVDDLKAWRASLTDLSESSRRRVCNDARAALNAAVKRHSAKLPSMIHDTIRDGFAVLKGKAQNTREKQILTDADVKGLIAAAQEIDGEQKWGGDLERLIVVLAATGARFSQVARLRVADLQVEQQRLMMPTSMKGGVEKKIAHTAIPLGADVIAALEPIVRGRKGTDPLLTRPFWRRAPGPGLGVLEVYEPAGQWSPSGTLTRAWKDIVERARLPEGTIIYALRHSSIVRGLRAGLPTQMVAKLHDTSSAMLEEYYTAFITDALDALARAALVPLMPTPVTPLRVGKG